MNANKLLFVSLALIILGVILKDPFTTVNYGPGVIAPEEPIQSNTNADSFFHNNLQKKHHSLNIQRYRCVKKI